MSKRKNNSREPAQIAELVLKNLDANELPRSTWLSTTELTAFILNKPIAELDVREVCNATMALTRIEKGYGAESKTLAGIDRHSPLKGSPFETDVIKVYPSLQEVITIPDNLREHCNNILGTKPKQLKPFTSEYFEQFLAVGSIIMIRFNKAKNIKIVQLTEIIYKPDSISEISAVTFGSQSYTLEELKDNLEYFQNDHWLPFGVYE
jgi:hypothetical protein